MEKFKKTLKELEDMIQKQDKKKPAKQMSCGAETTEEIEGCAIILYSLDAFAKKTFNDFFAKIFKYVKLKH